MTSNLSKTFKPHSIHKSRSLRSVAGFCLLFLSLVCLSLRTLRAQEVADEPETTTTPTATILGQYAATVATASTVTMTRTPITVGTTTVYWDITTTLTPVFNSGVLTGFTSVVTKAVLSPNLLVANFKAGKYIGPTSLDDGNDAIIITGPSVGAGGTLWSVSPATGGSYVSSPTPDNGSFWVGTLANNPDVSAARFKSAGITTAGDWSFGVLGDNNSHWYQGDLLGFQQVGNTIVIADFTMGEGDQSTPKASYTYTLVQ